MLRQKAQELFDLEGFEQLSEVQKRLNEGLPRRRDILCQSATGTGKTHAYLFYLLDHLDERLQQVQAIIVAPTRELAQQIYQNAKKIEDISELRVDLIIGGTDRNRSLRKQQTAQILIGTPGRLLDLFNEAALRLDQADYFVIDEADTIFEYGFIDEVDQIAAKLKKAQLLLFSATVPVGLKPFIKKYLHLPLMIEIEQDPIFKPRIRHVLVNRKHLDYPEALIQMLSEINPLAVLIFANTRVLAAKLSESLRQAGILHVSLHGDLSARERKQALNRIQNGDVNMIVATDIAARGMDLPEITHVINCGFPQFDHLSFYFHRAGRTGRAQKTGICFTLVNENDKRSIDALSNQGIEFEYERYKDGQWVETKPFFTLKKRVKRVNPEIQRIVNTKKNQVVKPGYKKKRQAQVEKIERQQRREMIDKSIKQLQKVKSRTNQRRKRLDSE